jgi:hypothetical protein
MKKIKLLLLFTLLVNCKTLTKISYGVKNPNFKKNVELYNFLKKNNINLKSIYFFKDFDNMIKGYELKYSTIPDAYFFNQNGNFIPYKSNTEQCNAKVDDFITDLKNINNNKSENKNINDFIPLLSNDKNEVIVLNEITVIITWATYLGKMNKQKAFEWIKLLEQAKDKGIKVNYYLVNYDLQECWEMKSDEKKEILESFKL